MIQNGFDAFYEAPAFLRITEPTVVSIEQRNRHARERMTAADATGSDLPNYFAGVLVNDVGRAPPLTIEDFVSEPHRDLPPALADNLIRTVRNSN